MLFSYQVEASENIIIKVPDRIRSNSRPLSSIFQEIIGILYLLRNLLKIPINNKIVMLSIGALNLYKVMLESPLIQISVSLS